MIRRYLRDEIDKTIALFGLIFGLALTIWLALAIRRPIYITVGVLSFLACGSYIILRKFISSSILSTLVLTKGSIRIYLGLNVLFFLLFAYSILCFHLRPDLFTRPLDYFIAIALMASLVAVEILFLPSRKWCSHFALFKIALIGLSLEFSELLIFPSVVGVDPWWHQMFTLNTLNTGHIPEGYGYSKLPFMHLMIGSTSLITGLDYKMATMLSVSLSQVLSNVLVTFLLGNFMFNKKVGLLGGLLLGVANWHVWLGYWTIPTTMAAVFIPSITYFLLKVREEKPHIGISLAILLMGALILTHTLTAMCMATFLFVFWIASKVYNLMYHRWKEPITLSISLLFAGAMFSWWTYASGHIWTFAELIKWGFSVDYFLGPLPEHAIQYAYNVPFSEQILNNLGMFFFFAMSLIGCLYMISKRFGNFYRSVMALSGTSIMAIGFFTQITGRWVLMQRWWYYSQILLALPLALAFFLFCWMVKNKLAKSLLLAALTFSLAFLMILNPLANLDNPTFSPNTQVRYALTESELLAINRVSSIWREKIGVDTHYSDLRWASYPAEDISKQIYHENYSDCQDIFILIREEIVNHPFKFIQVTYKLDYDPRDILTAHTFSRVYDCGSVSGFIYPKEARDILEP